MADVRDGLVSSLAVRLSFPVYDAILKMSEDCGATSIEKAMKPNEA